MQLQLPFPPSVNMYWRNIVMGKSARTIISKRGRQYRKDAVLAVQAMTCASGPLAGRLSVRLTLYPPDRRKRDLDNFCKALLDALTHANVWEDDSQIDDLRIVRGPVHRGGGLVVVEIDRAQRMLTAIEEEHDR